MKHALVIGGSGMLADLCLWLTEQPYQVSVLARSQEKMDTLIRRAKAPERITPVFADYEKDEALQEAVRKTIQKNGPVELAVAWIHSTAPLALPIVIETFVQSGQPFELYHVLSSSQNPKEVESRVPMKKDYHQIRLGSVSENGVSRWLTNEEISLGVIEAVQKRKHVHVVGQL